MSLDYAAIVGNITEDQTEVSTTGDFEKREIPGGKCVARLVSYIELGTQKQRPYKGKEKKPAPEVRVVFELFGKDHTYEIGADDTARQVHDRIGFTLTKSLHEKANFKKLFNAMTYGRNNITHMAQMLNELFLVTVHVTEKGEKGKDDYRRYTDLKKDGVWAIDAPVVQQIDDMGEVTGTKKIAVPADQQWEEIQLFIWDQPNAECWDSLHISGTYSKKIDGVETEVSKNWIQDKMQAATNYPGSPLELMFTGLGTDTSGGEKEPAEKAPVQPETIPEKAAQVDETAEAMAALGLA